MKLSELICKREIATATDATPATDKSVLASSVAKVASVAVANQETNKMVFSEKTAPIKAVTPVLEPSVATVARVNVETGTITPINPPSVAKVATVAVATETDGKPKTIQDRQREARRQKVIAMLNAAPGKQRTIYADTDTDPHNVILTIAVRACQKTCEMLIPKGKYDPWRLLELIERYGQVTH